MLKNTFKLLAWICLGAGVLLGILTSLLYGASFYFDLDRAVISNVFDNAVDIVLIGMVLIMWNER